MHDKIKTPFLKRVTRSLPCFAFVFAMACSHGKPATTETESSLDGFRPSESPYQVSSAMLGEKRVTLISDHYEVALNFGQSVVLARASSEDGRYVIESD